MRLPLACALALSVTSTAEARPPTPADHGLATAERRLDAPAAGEPVAAAREALGERTDLAARGARESLTGTHVRFQPLAPDGSPILDSEVIVELVGGRAVRQITREPAPGARFVAARLVDAAQARIHALGAITGEEPEARLAGLETATLAAAPDELRAGWRALVQTPAHDWELFVDGADGRVTLRRDLRWHAEGSGYVYKPNPVATSGDRTLSDGADADATKLTALRTLVVLPGLDGTGLLRGEWADVRNPSARASVATLKFEFTRADDRFEEVNAYFHVDNAQRNLQRLGFTGTRAIIARSFPVVVNGIADDNSFYSPVDKQITMGTGGVDDAEDGDVVVHEYGHAVHDDIIPGFGSSAEARAMGEGWGDLLASLTPQGTTLIDRVCIAAWDARGYNSECLRRVDGKKRYPEHYLTAPAADPQPFHANGEIWSGAMNELKKVAGLSADETLRLVTESWFGLPAGATFRDSAMAILAADERLFQGKHAAAIHRVFVERGLLHEITPPATVGTKTRSQTKSITQGPLGNLVDAQATISEPGATALAVHFPSIDLEVDPSCLEEHCDAIYLFDGQGRLYARLGGKLTDFTAPAIPGDTVIVRWVTDQNTPSNGFTIDRVDLFGQAPVPPTTTPDGGSTPPPLDPPDDEHDQPSAGACQVGGGGPGAAWLLLGLAALLVWRRRR